MVLYGQITIAKVREFCNPTVMSQAEIVSLLNVVERELGVSPVDVFGDLTEDAREVLRSIS